MPFKYKVAVVTVVALFIDLLDLTIVNLAIPTLRHEFGASVGQVQWAVTAYVLVVAIVMPASGWAADRFGAKRVFLFSLAAFTVGSALCAAAWSMGALIFARALQGVGGGLLVPVGMATLFRAFPEDERAKASAIFSVPAAVAPALGPLVGGLLIDTAGWRWIFLINVPIGIIGFVLGILWLREHRVSDAGSLDRKGFVLCAVALVALTYALSVAPDGPVLRASVLVPLLVGLMALAVFVRMEFATARPLVDVRLFAGRDFSLGNAAMFLASVGFGGLLFALPLFLQGPHAMDASRAGMVMSLHAIGIIVATAAGPALVKRLGARFVLFAGLLGSGLMALAFAFTDAGTSVVLLAAVLLSAGLSFGLTIVPLQTVPFRGMSLDSLARGTSILSVLRQVGVAIGTAAVAVPLGQGIVGNAGFPIAFALAGALTLVAVPLILLLPRVDNSSHYSAQPAAHS